MTSSPISIKGLSKSFGKRLIWSDLTLTVKSGEMLAITGDSGSGKSTLLNCLGLLEVPDGGQINYQGKNVLNASKTTKRKFRRDVLGYLFQNYALIESATVETNLDVAIRPQISLRRSKPSTDVAEALEHVGLAGRQKDIISHLSGGEQQRVALARLIVKKPALILADEPTGALDRQNSAMVVNALREMSEAGCAVIIATHNDYVRDHCDRIFEIAASEGKTIDTATN